MSARPRPIRPNTEIELDYAGLCHAAARRVLAAARLAIATRGRFSIALSGGTTPLGVYQQLASPATGSAAAWPLWHIFWGDERWAPPRSRYSNYQMACSALIDRVPVDRSQVHPLVPLSWAPLASGRTERVGHEGQAEAMEVAASAYEATLESELGVDNHFSAGCAGSAGSAGTGRRPPRIDLVLLGLGRDGHTASLFPGAGAVEERARWVVATPAPGGEGERSLPRLTLTLPVLNAAREVIFLASGIAKADVVAEVLEGADMPAPERRKPPLPAARVVPADGRLTWLLDEGAAGRLRPGP